jgi:hypothetical protein
MLELFEQNGGIALAKRPAHVVVVAPGTFAQAHEKWAMKDVPGIVWTRVTLLENAAAIKTFLETDDPTLLPASALYVLPGKNLDATIKDASFAALVAKMQALKAPVVGVDAAVASLKAANVNCEAETVAKPTYDAFVRLILKRSQLAGSPGPAAVEVPPGATTTIVLSDGYDDRQYAALQTFLDWQQQAGTVVGAKRGWLRGKEKCPAWVERAAGPADEKAAQSFAVGPTGAESKKGAGDVAAAAVAFAQKASAAPDDGPYTAAIALREGFDDQTYAAMRAALAWSGRKTAVVGPETGELPGLNGMVVKVSHSHAKAPELAANSIIVLPGGLYPDKVAQAQQAEQPKWLDQQAERDALRMKWIMDAYAKGATLVVAGYDGSRMAELESCKGLAFACPVHAGSKFANKPGKMSNEAALKTQDRVYSAQGFAALGALLRLLEQDGLISKTAGQKGK